MKNKLLLIIIISTHNLFSQLSIESNYNLSYISPNQSIIIKKLFNRIEIYGGLKYSINKKTNLQSLAIFKKTSYARSFSEHLGSDIGFEFNIFTLKTVKFNLFFDNQFSLSSVKIINYLAYQPLIPEPQSELDYSYLKSEKIFGKVLSIDNIIGISLNIELSNRIYLIQKVGYGLLFWKNYDKNFSLIGDGKINTGFYFTNFYNIGLGFKLNK